MKHTRFVLILNESSLKIWPLYTAATQGAARNCSIWRNYKENKPVRKWNSTEGTPVNHPDVEDRQIVGDQYDCIRNSPVTWISKRKSYKRWKQGHVSQMSNKAVVQSLRGKTRNSKSQNELQLSWNIKWKKKRSYKYQEVRGREGQRHK